MLGWQPAYIYFSFPKAKTLIGHEDMDEDK